MRAKMLDILACPDDKHHPLELFECATNQDDITSGALYCTQCTRFYPIIEGIPIMLPDDLRDKKQELEFLKTNRQNLPEKIIKESRPWHL